MKEDGDLIWAVGARRIEVTDLVLVRLDNVSKNNWQVQLQLLRNLGETAAARGGAASHQLAKLPDGHARGAWDGRGGVGKLTEQTGLTLGPTSARETLETVSEFDARGHT